MSASFVSASTQYLINSAVPLPSTGYPFSFGLWAYPTQTAANQEPWSVGDTGTSNNHWVLTWTTTSDWNLGCRAGGAVRSASATGGVVNSWQYIVGRCISSTNRRIALLRPNGSTAHDQDTVARAPTGIDTEVLGVRASSTFPSLFDGYVAEYWLANVDIQPGGAQLQDSLLRQLAYGGPFSVPWVRDNIVSYRGLKFSLGSDQNNPNDIWSPAPQTWVNTGGVKTGPHPPLPYWRGSPKTAIRGAVPI